MSRQYMRLGVILAGLTVSPAMAGAEPATSEDSRVAVMSAFAPEWVALQADLSDREDHVINGTTFVTGALEGKPVLLFLSGISMVNAAMTTQLALERFDIDRIVFSGIAGGVDPDLNIGDVVVPEQWGQYLEAIFAREVDGEFVPPSFISTSLPNYGMIFPREVDVARDGEIEERFWFKVDGEMLEIARSVAGDISLEDCAGETCLSETPAIVVGGNGVSGQAFVDNADFRQYVFDTFQASVLDMESAAVAHVAYANDVPFIAFRSLSDLAGGGEGENEIGTFMEVASDNSATVVKAFIAALP